MHTPDRPSDMGTRIRVIRRIQSALSYCQISLAAALIVLALVITGYAIIARNLGFSTGDWAVAIPEMSMVWMTLVCWGALFYTHEHITADFLIDLLPARWRRVLERVYLVVLAVCFLPILAGSYQLVVRAFRTGATNTEIFNIKEAWLQFGVLAGIALLLIQLILQLLITMDREAAPEEHQ